MFVLPVALLLVVLRAGWFARRRSRMRWAGERLLWWRDPMSDLGPLGEDPDVAKRRR